MTTFRMGEKREDIEFELAYPRIGREEATKASVVALLERHEAVGYAAYEVLDIRLVQYRGDFAYWILIQCFKARD
jgi:hypothetical protein